MRLQVGFRLAVLFPVTFATGLMWCSVPSARAQESTIPLEGSSVPPLYQAYNSKTGQLLPAVCVEGGTTATRVGFSRGPVAAPAAAAGTTPQLVSYSIDHVQDSQSLQSTLSLSASASLNVGYGSGSASYNYFSSSNFSSYSEYLSVQVEVENQTETHPNVRYKSDIQKLIDKKQYAEFYKTCGDSFIDGKVSGGYFLAIAKFDTTSSSEQVSTSAALQATVGLYGSASATMSSNLKTLASYQNVSVKIIRKAPNDKVDDSMTGIISYAQGFPNSVAGQNAYVTKIVLSQYPGDPVSSMPAGQATALNRLARTLGSAYQRQADLKYAANHLDQFPQISRQDMTDNQADIQDLIDAIKLAGNGCENDISKCSIANYPTVPLLPVRAEWHVMTDQDAKACPPEPIVNTPRGSDLSLEMQGYWTAWATGNNWLGLNQTAVFIQDRDGVNPQTKFTPVPNVLHKIPAFSVVSFMVGDGPTCDAFGDNRVDPANPLAWRIFDENPIELVKFGSLPRPRPRGAANPSQ